VICTMYSMVEKFKAMIVGIYLIYIRIIYCTYYNKNISLLIYTYTSCVSSFKTFTPITHVRFVEEKKKKKKRGEKKGRKEFRENFRERLRKADSSTAADFISFNFSSLSLLLLNEFHFESEVSQRQSRNDLK